MKALSTLLVLALGLAVVPKLIGADEPKAKPAQEPAGEARREARETRRDDRREARETRREREGVATAIRMCGLRFVRRFRDALRDAARTRILKIGSR